MIRIPGTIPITIHPFFWLLAALIGWMNTLDVTGTIIWIFIILVSVIVHEFGHALTAKSFGQHAQIELVAMGGVTQRRGGGKLKMWQEFIIVLNGPLAGFALSFVAWWWQRKLIISHPDSVVTYIALVTFYVNLFWTVVNLMPVQPLDGGKLLSIFMEALLGLRGKKIALFISVIFAAGMGIYFFAIQAYLAGSLFFLFTFESYRGWKSSLALTEQDQNFILQHLIKEAEQDLTAGRKEDALHKFQRISEMAKAGVIYQSATERAAHLLAERGETRQAYDLVMSLGNKLSPEGVRLLHQLAYRNGDWHEAISLGGRVYQHFPDYDTAVINAMCHSILGQARPAIGWLRCAIGKGMPNVHEVLAQKEFDAIRNDPLFRELTG